MEKNLELRISQLEKQVQDLQERVKALEPEMVTRTYVSSDGTRHTMRYPASEDEREGC